MSPEEYNRRNDQRWAEKARTEAKARSGATVGVLMLDNESLAELLNRLAAIAEREAER